MDYTFKKVLPEDVYVSIFPLDKSSKTDEAGNKHAPECANKLSGMEFMDIFARMLWYWPYADIKIFSDKMQVDTPTFACVVNTFSGISTVEWRDRYVNLAARELLAESMMSITDIAEYLGFTSIHTFSRYFAKHNGKSPKHWRYSQRGFNTNKLDIMKYKLRKNGIE